MEQKVLTPSTLVGLPMVERFVFGDLVPPVGHCKGLYLGSGKRQHWCSSQEDPDIFWPSKYRYYVFHLAKELFPKNEIDLEDVKTDMVD